MNDSETDFVPTDADAADLGFGPGGVPWYLMVLYLGFLVFFVWYVLEYQLPDFLDQSPIESQAPAVSEEASVK